MASDFENQFEPERTCRLYVYLGCKSWGSHRQAQLFTLRLLLHHMLRTEQSRAYESTPHITAPSVLCLI